MPGPHPRRNEYESLRAGLGTLQLSRWLWSKPEPSPRPRTRRQDRPGSWASTQRQFPICSWAKCTPPLRLHILLEGASLNCEMFKKKKKKKKLLCTTHLKTFSTNSNRRLQCFQRHCVPNPLHSFLHLPPNSRKQCTWSKSVCYRRSSPSSQVQGLPPSYRWGNLLRTSNICTFFPMVHITLKRRVKKLAQNSTFKKRRSRHLVPSLHGK